MEQKQTLLSSVVVNLRLVKWGDLPRLAVDTAVPESTIKKIRSGEVKDPRISTVEATQKAKDIQHETEAKSDSDLLDAFDELHNNRR
ncbi:MAG: hypothetical protein CML16_11110 [Pusillimonas sp.]|nr:hypothetical protein [Pusillimonas sp.]MBC40663.1 hypothetical protein [Pusillimonas sp.]HCP77730.1 hypothetical protein [Pusillimonas sp.]|tara:strand:+ start:1515 stop:1775 length:261 start_codon:yes stop_codon:yes gene_type:complete